MRLLAVVLILGYSILCTAQQLVVDPLADPALQSWNPTFMARNSISSITGTVSVKREGQPIRNKKKKYLYRFDSEGRVSVRHTTYGNPGTGSDTSLVHYSYTADGKLDRVLRTDLGGHFEQLNSYDSTGQLTRQTYGRVANLNANRYDLRPGERTEISDELYSYTKNKNGSVKTYLNDQGLPFREMHYLYNELGYLTQVEDLFLMSRKRKIEQFTYDEKGRLTMRLKQDEKGGAPIRYGFEYDSVGNLVKRELVRGSEQHHREEYLYSTENGLLTAKISKDEQSGIITIVKYSYTYH